MRVFIKTEDSETMEEPKVEEATGEKKSEKNGALETGSRVSQGWAAIAHCFPTCQSGQDP